MILKLQGVVLLCTFLCLYYFRADWSGYRVVVIGDSLTAAPGTPGNRCAELLTKAGATVELHAKDGRTISSFLQEEGSFFSSLFINKPDLVVIELGTNDIVLSDQNNDLSIFYQVISQLRAAQIKVVGIGPELFGPLAKPPQGGDIYRLAPAFTEQLKQLYGVDFIDSRDLTSNMDNLLYKRPDYVHFTWVGAWALGRKWFSALCTHLGK